MNTLYVSRWAAVVAILVFSPCTVADPIDTGKKVVNLIPGCSFNVEVTDEAEFEVNVAFRDSGSITC